jgi:RNA polymerase sigma factor (sigma-70 family)
MQLANDIRSAVNGSDDAWQRLLARYQPFLERWASAIECNGEMSQSDLIQDAWLRICQGLGSFEGVEREDCAAAFYNWLRSTSRNAMLNRVNGRKRIPVKPWDTDQTIARRKVESPSSAVANREQTDRIHQVIKELPSELDRQIIRMVFWERVSLRQIAVVLELEYSGLRRKFHSILDSIGQGLK